jgi:hypothetical protein
MLGDLSVNKKIKQLIEKIYKIGRNLREKGKDDKNCFVK